jgi:hypothetical protein
MLAEHCFAEFIREMILMCRCRSRSAGLKHNEGQQRVTILAPG